MASTVVQVRVDEKIKKEVSEIFGLLGLTLSDGFRLFMNRVVAESGIPFPMKLDKIDSYSDLYDVSEYFVDPEVIQ